MVDMTMSNDEYRGDLADAWYDGFMAARLSDRLVPVNPYDPEMELE